MLFLPPAQPHRERRWSEIVYTESKQLIYDIRHLITYPPHLDVLKYHLNQVQEGFAVLLTRLGRVQPELILAELSKTVTRDGVEYIDQVMKIKLT